MKEDFIAYDNLRVTQYDIKHITEVKIENDVNKHAKLILTGIVDDSVAASCVEDTDDETVITVYYEKDDDTFVLFNGLVTNIKTTADNYVYSICIEAHSLTYVMDINKVKRDFQNTSMTTHELIDHVMKPYKGAVYDINIPNEPIGQYILQYNETDYEFLKRIVSKYHMGVISAMELEHIHVYFGTPEVPVNPSLEINNYTISKAVEEFNDIKANDFEGAAETDFITYKIRTDEIFNVGENFNIEGQKYYVKKVSFDMKEASFNNVYELRPKGGLIQKRLYDMNLIGISIAGSIAEVQRDRVKINLDGIDSVSGASYWFPYSTVAASPDGGGWYCMPEVGERIRMNCPTKDEGEAYVVNAIEGSDGNGNERMSNPDNKSLQASGQEVNFTPNGVNLSCCGGQASMNLNKDGTIDISGQNNITISCGSSLNLRSEKEINISAQGGIKINCDSGSNLELTEGDEVMVKGTKDRNNG